MDKRETRAAYDVLQKHAEELSSLGRVYFEQTSDAALAIENGCIVEANDKAVRLFGYGREMVIGRPLRNLLADEEEFTRALSSKGSVVDYEVRVRGANGQASECLVTATARRDADRRVVSCVAVIRDVTERDRMSSELRISGQDYHGLFDSAHDAILILDPGSEIVVDANQAACLLYGFTREQFLGRSMLELSVDPQLAPEGWTGTNAGAGFATFESQHRLRDGSVLDVEINAGRGWHRGRPVILSINRDVTEHRKAESALRESEERLRLLMESITDYAIVMYDPDGVVLSWNQAAERIMGYTADDVVGKSGAMFLPPEEQARFAMQLAAAGASGASSRQVVRLRKGGGRFAASVVLTKVVDEAGSLRGFAEVVHDVTAREELEKAPRELVTILRQVANEWTVTFDAVQVPILMLDTKGEIRRLNRAAQMLAGRPFDQLIHRRVTELPGEPWGTIASLAQDAFAGNARSVHIRSDQSVWQVSASVVGSSEAARAIVVAYDLTLVTQLEASVREHQVAAALGSLVAGVAHEVRNPLFTISATLDAWEARYGRTEGIERYAGGLHEQVDRLNRLMRDLLEYGKPNPLVFSDAWLSDVICGASALCGELAAEGRVDIVHALADLPRIGLDAARMEQVFLNVIDNALRHSPAGGSVLIETVAESGQIVCRVLDDGPGIGTQDPEMLFTPMYTRRRGGTGLGLPIARNIVAAHGGTISVANRQEGKGAVVTIRLPLERKFFEERGPA